jgi:cholesterol transport system auxiliary component
LTLQPADRKDSMTGISANSAARREQARLPRIVLSGLVLLALTLSGCALLGGGTPALDTYELSAPTPPEGPRRRSVQVLIAEPSALKAFDGQNIVIRPADGAIEYLKGAQWADRLPVVIQTRLAETFQKSGRFGGVGTPGEGLAIDYQVIADIRAFEVRVGRGSGAHIELYVRILNDRNGVVRASKTFVANAALGGGSGNDAYVAALDAAFSEAAVAIVDWSSSIMTGPVPRPATADAGPAPASTQQPPAAQAGATNG